MLSVEQRMTGVSSRWQILQKFVTIWSHRFWSFSQGCQSGLMDLTVNQAGYALRRFESYPLQGFLGNSIRTLEKVVRE